MTAHEHFLYNHSLYEHSIKYLKIILSLKSMIINCAGCIIRPPESTDLKSYHKNINDPLIGKNLRAVNYPISFEEARASLARAISNSMCHPTTRDSFIIDVNGECAGAIQLSEIESDHKAKIGYWLGADYREKGIMKKAVIAMTQYGFREYNLRRIYAHVATFNSTSAGLLERCGYNLEGILKMNRLKNGEYFDDYLYSIIRNDRYAKD